MAQRRVELHGEAEGDAGLVGHLGDPLRGEVEVDAELLQDVGGAGGGGRGPVAVLDDLGAGAGHDERRHGGDVDRPRAVAARADDVDRTAGHLDDVGVLVHRPDDAGDLLDGLALGPQGHHEPGDLGVGRLTAHDPVHRPGGGVGALVAAVEQGVQHLGPGTARRDVASSGGHSTHMPLLGVVNSVCLHPIHLPGRARGPVRTPDGAPRLWRGGTQRSVRGAQW